MIKVVGTSGPLGQPLQVGPPAADQILLGQAEDGCDLPHPASGRGPARRRAGRAGAASSARRCSDRRARTRRTRPRDPWHRRRNRRRRAASAARRPTGRRPADLRSASSAVPDGPCSDTHSARPSSAQVGAGDSEARVATWTVSWASTVGNRSGSTSSRTRGLTTTRCADLPDEPSCWATAAMPRWLPGFDTEHGLEVPLGGRDLEGDPAVPPGRRARPAATGAPRPRLRRPPSPTRPPAGRRRRSPWPDPAAGRSPVPATTTGSLAFGRRPVESSGELRRCCRRATKVSQIWCSASAVSPVRRQVTIAGWAQASSPSTARRASVSGRSPGSARIVQVSQRKGAEVVVEQPGAITERGVPVADQLLERRAVIGSDGGRRGRPAWRGPLPTVTARPLWLTGSTGPGRAPDPASIPTPAASRRPRSGPAPAAADQARSRPPGWVCGS